MTLLWSLLVLTFILSAVGMLPSGWYTGPAEWLLARHRRQGETVLTRELNRLSAGTPFNASTSFLPRNLGVAVDAAAGKVFLAVRQDGKLRATLAPLADVQSVTQGERRDSGFYDYFVDVVVGGETWEIVCGENPELAAAVKAALSTP